MNNLNRDFIDEEGKKETLVASSNDNYQVKLGNYTLSNHRTKEESLIAKKFKNSILGADIGVKSSGFSSVAILAVVVVLAVALILYFVWRF